ncbi:HD domain-containing protein [uncultured Clostridium sp.]|uniref:HD domain-containing protein n=1 Tax=uncultured Clostridium sp. TaxID=59620 RepID=UPI0025E3F65C|nr:HD domain-containing protein [uncultured Clostridium sp.]
MDNIKATEEFLISKFEESNYFKEHKDEKEYRLEHTYRVANIGKEIAEREGLNVEAMIIACLLHDVSYANAFEEDDDWLNHGRNSAKIAREYLKQINISEKDIEDICYGIAIHVDGKSDFKGIENTFAVTVSDADNIDRFDVYRIYDILRINEFDKKSLSEKKEFVDTFIRKLNKLKEVEFATKTATVIWKDKIEYQLSFFNKLKTQLSFSIYNF